MDETSGEKAKARRAIVILYTTMAVMLLAPLIVYWLVRT